MPELCRRGRRGGAGCRAALFALLGLVAVLFAFPGEALASTVPDAGLGSLILSEPEPGWTQAPASAVSEITDRLEKIDSNAVGGETVDVAARMWAPPDGASLLAITLSQWPSNLSNFAQIMHTAFDDECVSVTGDDPTSTAPVPSLSDSLSTLCTTPTDSAQLAVVVAGRGVYMEMVESIAASGSTPLGVATLGAIARQQFGALPASSSSPFAVGYEGLGAIATLCALVGLVLACTKAKKRRRPVPATLQVLPPATLLALPSPTAHPPQTPAGGPAQRWAYSRGGGAGAADGAGGAADVSRDACALSVLPGKTFNQAPTDARRIAELAGVPVVPGLFAPEPEAPPVLNGQAARPVPEGDGALPSLGAFLSSTDIPQIEPARIGGATLTVGWHEAPTNPNERRYWDGASWTSVVQWSGTEWVTVG